MGTIAVIIASIKDVSLAPLHHSLHILSMGLLFSFGTFCCGLFALLIG